jgi:hypothetical protein
MKSFIEFLSEGVVGSLVGGVLKKLAAPAVKELAIGTAEKLAAPAVKELAIGTAEKLADPAVKESGILARQALQPNRITKPNSSDIYNLLTTRPNPTASMPPVEYMRDFTQRMSDTGSKLAGSAENPGWMGYNIKPKTAIDNPIGKAMGDAGVSSKRYFSFDKPNDPNTLNAFRNNLPGLHQRMTDLSDHFGVPISFKHPNTAGGMMGHTDSIVTHFKDLPDSSLSRSIDATTKKWAEDAGLKFLDRQGMEHGVDIPGKSHTALVADEMARAPVGSEVSLSDTSRKMLDRHLAPFRGGYK